MTHRFSIALLLAVSLISSACGDDNGAQSGIPEDFAIAMKRQLCFGPCPGYTVTADASGAVSYEGERFVRIRSAVGRVRSEDVRTLLAQIEEIHFFDLEDEYWYGGSRCGIPYEDAPTVIVSATRSGVTHEVRHYLGCSGDPVLDELGALELKIDQTLRTSEWVFCSPNDSFFYTSCDERPG